MIRTAGILSLVNWAVFLFPTTLLLFSKGIYELPWRIFIALVMGTILIISIHSIRARMNDRLRFIFLIFHGLLLLQSVIFLIFIVVLGVMEKGIPF